MRPILTFLARFVAVVFAAVFVLTAPAVLLVFNADRQLFDPGLYKRVLIQQHVYEKFPALVGQQIVFAMTYNPCRENPDLPECLAEGPSVPTEEGTGGPPPYLRSLSPADWEIILADLLPADWLRAQIEGLIDQAFAYLESDSPDVAFTISTRAIKERIMGDAGLHAVMQIVATLPRCTAAQLNNLTQAQSHSEIDNLLACRPPEEALPKFTSLIEQALLEVASEMPDEAVLNPPDEQANQQSAETGEEAPAQNGNSGPVGGDPRLALRVIRWTMRLSPVLSVALLLLITLFGVRSFKGLLRWWGIPLLLSGLLSMGLAVTMLPAMNWAMTNYVADNLPSYLASGGIVQLGFEIGQQVVKTLVTWVGGEAAILTLAGLVMLIWSLRSRSEVMAQRHDT
jgi:hypothetical protein